MFFAVKSWNFVDLVCLLFAGRGFKNCLIGMAGTTPQPYRRKRSIVVCISHVGRGGLV